MFFDNWGYDDPGDVEEFFDPWEADDYIMWLIGAGQIPKVPDFLERA